MHVYLQELSDPIHPNQEFLIEIESLPAVLLVHVKELLQKVYDAIVVAREQSEDKRFLPLTNQTVMVSKKVGGCVTI